MKRFVAEADREQWTLLPESSMISSTRAILFAWWTPSSLLSIWRNDVYRCPAGEILKCYFTAEEHGQRLRRYWTNACRTCALKSRCTTAPQRRITRWEHEHVLEAVQRRLDANPHAMRARRTTVEHPFGTIKARMGATHFLMKRLPRVATEMALHVLAYNLTRVLNIVGIKPMMAVVGA